MKKLLALKHWQLFVLIILPVVIFQLIATIVFIQGSNVSFVLPFALIATFLACGVFFSWLYALGTNLYKKLPAASGLRLKRFKILFFIPLIYILLFPLFITWISGAHEDAEVVPVLLLLVFPLHLLAMFCIFYCLYFNAKSLKAVMLQRPVTFNDFAGEFFLLWFFPVGIWILQPQINKLFANTDDAFQPKLQ